MSQVVIITGMHRSGTSLVSSLFQQAGVHVGDRLIAANSANPRGYFEDVDFYEFHEQLLHHRDQSYLYVDHDFAVSPTQAELERAGQLIDQRAHLPLWGWKDPRTALFLELWHDLLPKACYLFVYRHPLEVLLSLLRRGEFDSHPSLEAGLHAWQVYNARIKSFYDEHKNQCLLVHIDGVVSRIQQFADLLHTKLPLDFRLDLNAFQQIFHATELQRTLLSPDVSDVFAKICPKHVELYQTLNALADLPADPNRADSVSPPPLSSLAAFIASLTEPFNVPSNDSLLQLLASILAPEATETMHRRFGQNARGAQQKIDVLWMYAQNLERMNADQAKVLEQQQQAELARQTSLESMQFQLQELHEGFNRQSSQIDALRSELDGVYETRAWKLIHGYSNFKQKLRRKAS